MWEYLPIEVDRFINDVWAGVYMASFVALSLGHKRLSWRVATAGTAICGLVSLTFTALDLSKLTITDLGAIELVLDWYETARNLLLLAPTVYVVMALSREMRGIGKESGSQRSSTDPTPSAEGRT